jgi:hypothetical protein
MSLYLNIISVSQPVCLLWLFLTLAPCFMSDKDAVCWSIDPLATLNLLVATRDVAPCDVGRIPKSATPSSMKLLVGAGNNACKTLFLCTSDPSVNRTPHVRMLLNGRQISYGDQRMQYLNTVVER